MGPAFHMKSHITLSDKEGADKKTYTILLIAVKKVKETELRHL